VGLYLNPPDRAIGLCVDEKSQVQALNRTQPILPLEPQVYRGGNRMITNGTESCPCSLPGCSKRSDYQQLLQTAPPGVSSIPQMTSRRTSRVATRSTW
jgi:hypothetical protein